MKVLQVYLFKKAWLKLIILIIMIITLSLSVGCDQTDTVSDFSDKAPVFKSDIPEFGIIKDTKEKKTRFFSYMRPLIELENASVLKKRKRLLDLYEEYLKKTVLSPEDLKWLENIQAEYKVKWTYDDPDYLWEDLLKRVDILPVELALIQAAKESGWGTSRFVRTGNNMFGQWCFKKGCGIVPDGREDGARHEVRKFKSVSSSVRSYIHNLNTHTAYDSFRQLRYEQRQLGMEPNGYGLVSEMPKYSERGEAYIEEVRDMILTNMAYMGS